MDPHKVQTIVDWATPTPILLDLPTLIEVSLPNIIQ